MKHCSQWEIVSQTIYYFHFFPSRKMAPIYSMPDHRLASLSYQATRPQHSRVKSYCFHCSFPDTWGKMARKSVCDGCEMQSSTYPLWEMLLLSQRRHGWACFWQHIERGGPSPRMCLGMNPSNLHQLSETDPATPTHPSPTTPAPTGIWPAVSLVEFGERREEIQAPS